MTLRRWRGRESAAGNELLAGWIAARGGAKVTRWSQCDGGGGEGGWVGLFVSNGPLPSMQPAAGRAHQAVAVPPLEVDVVHCDVEGHGQHARVPRRAVRGRRPGGRVPEVPLLRRGVERRVPQVWGQRHPAARSPSQVRRFAPRCISLLGHKLLPTVCLTDCQRRSVRRPEREEWAGAERRAQRRELPRLFEDRLLLAIAVVPLHLGLAEEVQGVVHLPAAQDWGPVTDGQPLVSRGTGVCCYE